MGKIKNLGFFNQFRGLGPGQRPGWGCLRGQRPPQMQKKNQFSLSKTQISGTTSYKMIHYNLTKTHQVSAAFTNY